MLSTKLKEAAGNSADATLYVDDVFSTYLYTGNGSTQTITNGIDLAGKGGLVWVKSRSSGLNHSLVSSVASANSLLFSNTTSAEYFVATGSGTTLTSTGFSLGSNGFANTLGDNYASWTFREAAKFFDVVTYTGDGDSSRRIAHSLNIEPGLIIIKKTSFSGNWFVGARTGLSGTGNWYGQIYLNTTAAAVYPSYKFGDGTNTNFAVGGAFTNDTNYAGETYVAYLFAHDTTTTGIIRCGSYTGNGSATGPTVSLGWEPQYLMVKNASGTGNWQILDSMRGMPVGAADATLQANLSNAESSVEYLSPTATGFQITSTSTEVNTSGSTYIYMAIRRPNKPPTTGTQVFGLNARTGTGANATVTGGQTDDAVLIKNRGSAVGDLFASRLIGTGYLETSSTAAEVAAGTTILQANPWDVMDGVKVGTTSTITNASANTFINYFFKRAPGFFDVVCYTGTSSATTQAHNLGVVPELIIVKCRNQARSWAVGTASIGWTGTNAILYLEQNVGVQGVNYWNTTNPTSTVFSLGVSPIVNGSGNTNVAYLFATLTGISKVGSYTGNGSSQNIECGFAAGARFVLVKRTDAAGDWYVLDSARGIVSANDPHLSLNTTAAEVTTDDSVDPYSAGFAVNQVAATNINVSSATYIFLAIA